MYLCEKRNLDYYNYKNLADRLLSFVEIVEYDFYKDSYLVVEPEVNQIDPKDIDYVALSYKL
jgi:predicted nucleic acid-binding protein